MKRALAFFLMVLPPAAQSAAQSRLDVDISGTWRMADGDDLRYAQPGFDDSAWANARRGLFGFERTRAISGRSAIEIAGAAKAFGQNDDITVVTVRRAG